MRKALSLLLVLTLFLLLFAPVCGCSQHSPVKIKGIHMVSGGVVLSTNAEEPLNVKVYNRYGNVIFSELKSVTLEDFPQLHRYVTGSKLYFLDFARIAEITQEGSYKCRYSLEGSKTYLEHTYIVSPTPPENPEIYSANASLQEGTATITVKTDPTCAHFLNVWTDDVPEEDRFTDTALECISDYEQISRGEMIYSLPAATGSTLTFVTRPIYSSYSYMPDEIIKVDNPEYTDFVSEVVCIDLLNPNDMRVANLGNETHMKKFTVYTPGESTVLDTLYVTPPPTPAPPPKLTAELTVSGTTAKLTVSTYPNVAYYRAVITEICNGEEKVVYNDSIAPNRLYATVGIRTDKPATYKATVYAKLTDGSATNRVDVPGFTTSFVAVPTPSVSYSNGEVTAVFPKNANVTVWKSGAPISTDTLVLGSNGVYSYIPDGKGEYGFVFKVTGNGAEVLDSNLTETKKVTVK